MSYHTTVRGPDILRGVIVSGYVPFNHTNKFFVNILLFHCWNIVFAGWTWPGDRSLEAPWVKLKIGKCFLGQQNTPHNFNASKYFHTIHLH